MLLVLNHSLTPRTRWGNRLSKTPTTAAADAHWGGAIVYDFLKSVLKRRSLDGQGGALRIAVHVPAADGNREFRLWCG